MEEGFPGNLEVAIKFAVLKSSNDFSIDYTAKTDKATPINLTNHSYFNLKGAGKGNVLDHLAHFAAAFYTPLNADMIPTGEIAPVKGTPYDFTEQQAIGAKIADTNGGYDINLVLQSQSSDVVSLGTVAEPTSGRCLAVSTNQPGVQFFTANQLDGAIAGIGGPYAKHGGFCLETQCYPDSINQPSFPNSVLRPGEIYKHHTQFSFRNAH